MNKVARYEQTIAEHIKTAPELENLLVFSCYKDMGALLDSQIKAYKTKDWFKSMVDEFAKTIKR
jgi:hypothetical protein